MPLIMLGNDYSRSRSRYVPSVTGFGADTAQDTTSEIEKAANAAVASGATKPGSFDWNQLLDTIVETGGDVTKFLLNSKRSATTASEKTAVDNAAIENGITLAEASPYLIGGAALLVVLVLMMSRKRRGK